MIRTTLSVILLALSLSGAASAQALSWAPKELTAITSAGSETPIVMKAVLSNIGGAANFVVVEGRDWLTISPQSGALAAGESVEVTLTLNPTNLPTGEYDELVVATALGSQIGALLQVKFVISGLAILTAPQAVTVDPVPDGFKSTLLEVLFSDSVSRTLNWTVETMSGGPWLKVTQTPPVTTPVELVLTVDATNKKAGEVYKGKIVLKSPDADYLSRTVDVTMTVFDGEQVLTLVPRQLNFYTFGVNTLPPQPLQILTPDGRAVDFNVTAPPDPTPITPDALSGRAPAHMFVRIDPQKAIIVPRRDNVTFTPNVPNGRETVVAVNTMSEPPRVNVIPQIADGGPFRTTISISNQDSVAARVTLRFYQSQGQTGTTLPWNLKMENDASVENINIPAGGAWSVRTAGATQAILQGWAEVVSNQKVAGTAVFEQTQADGRKQEAAVPVNNTLMQRLMLPFDNTGRFVTSVALINMSSLENAEIEANFRDDAGNVFKRTSLPTIPPRGHRAFELKTLFPDLDGKRGTLDLNTMTGQISLLGLRFNPDGAFTSFEAQTLNRRPEGKMSIPQIVDGTGFTTEITLVNKGTRPANVNLTFYRNSGGGATVPWPLELEGRIPGEVVLIPAAATVTLKTAGLSAGTQIGWAEMTTTDWVTGFAVYRQRVAGRPDQEATVPVNVATPFKVLLPFDNTGPFTMAVAIANISSASVGQFNVTATDENGQKIYQGFALDPVPARGHVAFNLKEVLPNLAGKRGAILFSSTSGEMSLLGLRFLDSGAFTSIKANPVQ